MSKVNNTDPGRHHRHCSVAIIANPVHISHPEILHPYIYLFFRLSFNIELLMSTLSDKAELTASIRHIW